MQIDYKRRYRLGAVAKAADVPNSTLASWLQREQIELMKGDKKTAGTGDHRLFSWFRIINIAIVAELNRLGIPPSAGSSRLALSFSDVGGAVAYFEGEKVPPVRLAGGLNPVGETFLLIQNLDGVLHANVTDKLNNPLIHGNKCASSVIVIDMDRLVHRVLARLQEAEAEAEADSA
jgi:hypothetical protein